MIYEFSNIDYFSEEVRHFVFSTFILAISKMLNISPEQASANKDAYITPVEVKNIVLEFVEDDNKISKKNIVNVCSAVNSRIFSNILSKLASEDLVECAFSDDDNQFVFSLTEKGKEKGIQIQLPEVAN